MEALNPAPHLYHFKAFFPYRLKPQTVWWLQKKKKEEKQRQTENHLL